MLYFNSLDASIILQIYKHIPNSKAYLDILTALKKKSHSNQILQKINRV